MNRVVITGMGLVSSLGHKLDQVTEALMQGKSGIVYNPKYCEMGFKSCVSGSIDETTLDKSIIDRKLMRFLSKASLYALLSAYDALKQAGLSLETIHQNPRVGVVAGSGGASTQDVSTAVDMMRTKGLRGVGAMAVPKTMASTVSASLATGLKIGGVSYSIASACATSTHCIGQAFDLIRTGRQDVVIAAGGEEEHWTQSCMFDAMGAMSTQYNDAPKSASRAYDAERDGFVIAGGGGAMVIESLAHAKARGAHILAEIVGFGATSDGADMVAPSGKGAVRCMRLALEEANLATVDYINTHGTSTPIGDVTELDAIAEVFGQSPAISSTKSMTGHSLGAVGVQEAIFCVLMMQHGFIAPSININTQDERTLDFDIVKKTRQCALKTVMTNSFGFGGTNACLVLKAFDDA